MSNLKYFSILFIFSLTLFTPFQAPLIAADEWEKVRTEDDIIVYKKKNHSSKIIPIKSRALINAPFNIVLSILADVKRKKEWAPNYITSKTLEKKDDFNRIEYNVTDVPWPFNDRDFVFKVKTIINKQDRTITIKIRSIQNYYPIQSDYVRGKIISGEMIIKALKDNSTELTMIVEADPAGSIPGWLANYASRLFPYRFIRNLKLQANKLAKEKEFYLQDYNPFN